jgi:hypothetical protein
MEEIDTILTSPDPLTKQSIVMVYRSLEKLLKEDSDSVDLEKIHKCEEDLYVKFIRNVSEGTFTIGEIQDLAKNVAALKRLQYKRSY